MPSASAILRQDQCVLPSVSFCCVLRAMRACTWAVATRLATFVAWIEARNPVLLEALFPTRDGRSGRAQAAHDLGVGRAVSQRQNQPCAEDITGRQRARLRPLSQLHSLFVGY